jgi:methylmalonyl-CoA mutase N-terminal domain/subunit
VFVVDERLGLDQCERLRAVRARRDAARVQAALRELTSVAAGTRNLLPPILDAVRAYTTVGEICDALREVFGIHQETVVL